jgi:nitroimidazol reductase NimA-like FMN-containing flavoprotein (pyridoxamine 5'-phosphate oxidase superfamily)
MNVDRNGLEVLTRAECLSLLAGRPVGRVAFVRDGRPAILPVTYRLLGEDIVFATGTGSKSVVIGHQSEVAFEVDDIDAGRRSGWSVLAVGTARQLDQHEVGRHAVTAQDLKPWVGPHAVHLMCVPTDQLSGRRLAAEARLSSHAVG